MCDGLVIDLTGVSFQEHAPVNYREELNITTGASVQRWWIPMTSAQRDGLKDAFSP
jgi:hypothetical protein